MCNRGCGPTYTEPPRTFLNHFSAEKARRVEVFLVNPVTGVHTQHVESYWNQVKTKFKRMKGVHDTMLSSYVDEYMWRERHGQTGSTAMNSLFRDIAQRYPV